MSRVALPFPATHTSALFLSLTADGSPGGGGISVAWHGTIFVARNWCRRGWRCPQKARGALLRALVCPGPADGPGRLCKHETADPKVATALPQPTEAGGVSADTGIPSGGCRLLARPAGLAIVELSRAADARHASDVGDCDGECRCRLRTAARAAAAGLPRGKAGWSWRVPGGVCCNRARVVRRLAQGVRAEPLKARLRDIGHQPSRCG